MNRRPSLASLIAAINRHAPAMGGVFSTADLANLIGRRSPLATARTLHRLCRDGVIQRVQRGLYVSRPYDARLLAARVFPDAYISLDSALALHGLIGPIPPYQVAMVGARRGRRIQLADMVIQRHTITKNLLFGFARTAKGVAMADPEKAFLDCLYFYTKGHRLVIDPRREVRTDRLYRPKVLRYLRRYRNPKFVQFVKGVLHGA